MKTALLNAAFSLVHLLCPLLFVMCIVRVAVAGA